MLLHIYITILCTEECLKCRLRVSLNENCIIMIIMCSDAWHCFGLITVVTGRPWSSNWSEV